MNSGLFSIGRAAFALGFSADGKARRFVDSILAGDKPGGNVMAIAGAFGVHPDLASGALKPYPADVHRAIVQAMVDKRLKFRKAAAALGFNPVRASVSAATCVDTWKAIVSADCLQKEAFQPFQEYHDELRRYLSAPSAGE